MSRRTQVEWMKNNQQPNGSVPVDCRSTSESIERSCNQQGVITNPEPNFVHRSLEKVKHRGDGASTSGHDMKKTEYPLFLSK